MKNVTISMDEETATWTLVQAAHANKSVSKYIAELLERERLRDSGYAAAMKACFAQKAVHFERRTNPCSRRDA